jgi:hypothetical protein
LSARRWDALIQLSHDDNRPLAFGDSVDKVKLAHAKSRVLRIASIRPAVGPDARRQGFVSQPARAFQIK